MDLVLLLARLVLAAIFLVAGLAKLADRAGSREALIGFGLPAALAAPGGTLLPLAELVVAVALIPVATAWWAAFGALALLVAFVAGIGYNLAKGRTPDCHCFGQLHSAPAGWPTLIRNVVLALLAGIVVAQGADATQPSAFAWLGPLTGTQIAMLISSVVLFGLLAAQGWLLLNLLQQNGRLLVRIEALEASQNSASAGQAAANAASMPIQGLAVGTPAPSFHLSGLHGETNTLEALRASTKPVLLIFSDPGCGPCTALLPDLARWQRDHAAQLTLALISRGTVEANRAKITEHGLTNVLLQQDREVAEAYQVLGTPTAVLVQPDGTIGSPLVLGADAIAALVAQLVSAPAPVPQDDDNGAQAVQSATLSVGAPAPLLMLPDLDGMPRSLTEFQRGSTLLLFWDPGCGFCQRMLDELKAWEAHPPKGAPQLVLISSGSVEANRSMGLQSPILLDLGFSAGRQFGATGTPMAVLLDAQGRIASELAAGAAAVLKLAHGPHQMQPIGA